MSKPSDVRLVRVTFDAVAQRWELADDGFSGRTELETLADGLSIGRNAAGTIVELVIDSDDGGSSASEPITLQLVADSFGPPVAELLRRGAPDGDLDVVVDVPGFWAVQRSAPSAPPVAPGEPGIPTQRPDGSYAVPSGRAVLTLEVYADRLVVRAPRGAASPDAWAVVAAADSGDVVAMGPMEPSGDGGTSAHLSFGLPLRPDDLFVTATSEPLTPIDERAARQRRWAFDLLDQAESDLRFRPRRALRSAATAHTIGTAHVDQRLTDRATRVTGRARRSLWLWLGGVVTILTLAITGTVLLGNDDSPSVPSAPSESTVYFTNCDAARAAGPTPLRRDDPGYRPGLDRDGDGIACEG